MADLDWQQETERGRPANRHAGRAGALHVATVMFDETNGFWVWTSHLADDAWGWGPSLDAAQRGFEAWLRTWLENFRPFLSGAGRPSDGPPSGPRAAG